MTELAKESTTLEVETLLHNYGFDLGGYTAKALIDHWSHHHPAPWLKFAVIEALYQGRYKAVSVDQILTLWHRRGQPCQHFNHEFERIVCSRLPRDLTAHLEPTPAQLLWSERTVNPPARPSPERLFRSSSAATIPAKENPKADAIAPANPPELMPKPPGFESESTAPQDLESSEATPSNPLATADDAGDDTDLTLKIQTFKPASMSDLHGSQDGNWSKGEAVKHPIHQFIPTAEVSEFYIKLKAVSQIDESAATENLTMTAVAEAKDRKS